MASFLGGRALGRTAGTALEDTLIQCQDSGTLGKSLIGSWLGEHQGSEVKCDPSFPNAFGLFILPQHYPEMLGPRDQQCPLLLSLKWHWWGP